MTKLIDFEYISYLAFFLCMQKWEPFLGLDFCNDHPTMKCLLNNRQMLKLKKNLIKLIDFEYISYLAFLMHTNMRAF